MMSEAARNLLLFGDRAEGLKAYKDRIYRKMDATSDEKVRRKRRWQICTCLRASDACHTLYATNCCNTALRIIC